MGNSIGFVEKGGLGERPFGGFVVDGAFEGGASGGGALVILEHDAKVIPASGMRRVGADACQE